MQKRYAIVGLGDRSRLYTHALLTTFREQGLLAGYCDANQTRMSVTNRHYAETLGTDPVPMYNANTFDRMIREQKIDTVIVTSMDSTHHHYITKAMELGCDVITEKPMTIDAPKCQAVLDTQKQTGRSLIVTFNYRYSPHNTQIKSILRSGAIGKVLSVHFEWLLDTWHGADYFRRWHREKENSGGLMVHKDERMLADIFLPRSMPDPLQRAANHIHGALAILPGIAANQSFATGQPVTISDLVTF